MSRYFTKTLASLEPYTPGEQLKIADIVKLNANENPYPPAPGVAATELRRRQLWRRLRWHGRWFQPRRRRWPRRCRGCGCTLI